MLFLTHQPLFIKKLIGVHKDVEYAAAGRQLTAADSGKHFVTTAVDQVFSLPLSSAALKGWQATFEAGILSTSLGLSISPKAADAIGGNGLGIVVDKDLINTAASDRIGDQVTLYCTGQTGAAAFRISSIIGTWAKES